MTDNNKKEILWKLVEKSLKERKGKPLLKRILGSVFAFWYCLIGFNSDSCVCAMITVS